MDDLLNEIDDLIYNLRKLELNTDIILEYVFENYPQWYECELEYQQYRLKYSDTYFRIWSWNVGSCFTDHVQWVYYCYVFWIMYVSLYILTLFQVLNSRTV